MHGRVKVKTDSQKAEEKKQRRLEQLEQFKSARNKIDQLFSSIQKVKKFIKRESSADPLSFEG